MNQTPSTAQRSYRTLMAFILAIASLLFSVNCALADVTALSYVSLAAFFAFIVVTTRSKILVIAFGAFAVFGSTMLPVWMVSYLLSGIGMIAAIAAAIRNKHYFVLASLPLAYGVCLAISADPITALGALVLLPPALVFGILLRRNAKQGTLIASIAACLLLLPVAALTVLVYQETGSVSLAFFTDYIEAFRDAFIPEMSVMFEELGVENAEEILLESFNSVIRLLPAISIITCELVAYLAVLLGVSLADTDKENPLPAHTCSFRMETASAVVFLASLVLSFLLQGTTGTTGVLWISAQNLYLILLPGLALQELLLFVDKLRARKASILLPLLLVVFLGALLPALLALLGAFYLIRDSRSHSKGNSDDI